MDREQTKQRIIQRIHPALYPINYSTPNDIECLCSNKRNLLGARHGFAMMEISEHSVLEAISYARAMVKQATRAKCFFGEFGLYLLLLGKEEQWLPVIKQIRADKTGTNAVIIQAIHCLDLDTGASHLSQSKWGPHTFGETALPAIINSGLEKKT